MAEAIVNDRMGDVWEAVSAGTTPTGYVHPKALAVLAEIGIVHEGESKSVDDFRDVDLDLVVTVCGGAKENCPVWLGKGKKIHVGFDDPAEAEGSEEEILTVFRRVRDEILDQIPANLSIFNS